jgi:hypothetical protein
MAVSASPAPEHRAGEQAFTPERHQAGSVEVLRMKRPKAHA